MKICPLCHTTYEDWIDFCFNDGMPLVSKGGVSSPLPVKPASQSIAPAPRLADEADLPSPGSLRPPVAPQAPAGAGDSAPARPPTADVPRDITGIFTGPITDEDGHEFRREPPRMSNNLADLTAAPDYERDATRPLGTALADALDEQDATRPLGTALPGAPDEQDSATVPLSSSALVDIELPAVAGAAVSTPPVAVVLPATPVEVVSDVSRILPGAPMGDVVDPTASAPMPRRPAPTIAPPMEPIPAAAPIPPAAPKPARKTPAEEPSVLDEPAPSSGTLGVGLLAAGLVVGGALLLAAVAAAAYFMGGNEPQKTPVAVVEPKPPAPAVPLPVAAAPPPVVEPVLPEPLLPAEPPVALTPSGPPAGSPVGTPPTSPPPKQQTPASEPTATPVSTKPTAAPQVTADASPWGAPAPATSGVLKIVTDPDGATVYIDEQQRGRTPLTVELAYGAHNIRVVRSGYKTEVREVTIRVAELNVPFILKPEVVTGQVNVYGPAGFRVFIDGVDRGAMPVTAQVSEGVRQFKLVSDADGAGCSLPKEITFRSPGRPETVTLACP